MHEWMDEWIDGCIDGGWVDGLMAWMDGIASIQLQTRKKTNEKLYAYQAERQ